MMRPPVEVWFRGRMTMSRCVIYRREDARSLALFGQRAAAGGASRLSVTFHGNPLMSFLFSFVAGDEDDASMGSDDYERHQDADIEDGGDEPTTTTPSMALFQQMLLPPPAPILPLELELRPSSLKLAVFTRRDLESGRRFGPFAARTDKNPKPTTLNWKVRDGHTKDSLKRASRVASRSPRGSSIVCYPNTESCFHGSGCAHQSDAFWSFWPLVNPDGYIPSPSDQWLDSQLSAQSKHGAEGVLTLDARNPRMQPRLSVNRSVILGRCSSKKAFSHN